MEQKIKIDLKEIQEIANLGVRRTAVFMGLGINAANDPDFTNYSLAGETQLQFVPPDADPDTIDHLKQQFAYWIIGNGLRELIETFSVFLERVHWACTNLALKFENVDPEEAKKGHRRFLREGFPRKLELLRGRFGVGSNRPDCLTTINRARNCFAHRRGIVGARDCDHDNHLRVTWIGMDLFARLASGEEISLNNPPDTGVRVNGPADVVVRFPEKERLFPQGSYIVFSPRELAEVCLFVQRSSRETIQMVEQYAQRLGVPFDDD